MKRFKQKNLLPRILSTKGLSLSGLRMASIHANQAKSERAK